jgi:hypothetical protein
MQAKRIPFSSNKVRHFFKYHRVKSLAKKLGATYRKDRKFSVVDMILGYWQLMSIGEFSFDQWASQISLLTRKPVSGQALFKRMRPEMILLLKSLLVKSFQSSPRSFISEDVYSHFSNVLIQDATHFSLPRSLSHLFPGSYSRYGPNSTAKVQATFNMKKGSFVDFNLQCFRDTDQKDSNRIASGINKGDLIIRDLGYFVLPAFNQIIQKGGYFLTRLKYGCNLFDKDTGCPIDLFRLLKKGKDRIDIPMKLGNEHKVPCRLVCLKVPKEAANRRRRIAKNDRNKKANHSKKYLSMLDYTIFVTNVEKDVWSVDQVEKAYRGRWYIEILFKGWKSHLRMKNLIPERYINQTRAEYFFYASLLMVNILVLPTFLISLTAASHKNKFISILKVCSFISNNMSLIIKQSNQEYIYRFIFKACKYETRKDRTNMLEFLCNKSP